VILRKLLHKPSVTRRLVEGVGAGSPVGKEHAETDSLEDTGNGANGDGVQRALLSEDLGDDLGTLAGGPIREECRR
jgi:hypothetical protein